MGRDSTAGPELPGDPRETTSVAAGRVANWHRLFGERVEAFLRGLTRDAELSADVTQTVFAKAMTQCPDALLNCQGEDEGKEGDGRQTHSDVRAWLFTVARNEAMSRLRRKGVERRVVAKLPVPPPSRPDAAGSLMAGERAEAVRKAVESLKDNEQELIWRHYRDGWTFARIAEAGGEPLGTVLSRAHRTIAKLRKVLEEAEDEL